MEEWVLNNEDYIIANVLNYVFMAALAMGLFYGTAHLLDWVMEWIKRHRKK